MGMVVHCWPLEPQQLGCEFYSIAVKEVECNASYNETPQ